LKEIEHDEKMFLFLEFMISLVSYDIKYKIFLTLYFTSLAFVLFFLSLMKISIIPFNYTLVISTFICSFILLLISLFYVTRYLHYYDIYVDKYKNWFNDFSNEINI
jgi:hypothetical protein